jgi:hypothetical protein
MLRVLKSGLGGDVTPPSVVILSPSNGDVVPATFTVSGTATDVDSGIALVEVQVNSDPWLTATGTNSWSRAVAVTTGWNTLTAKATNGVGISTSTSINVLYDPTGPNISILSPANGTIFPNGTTSTPISGTASDPESGIALVELNVNGSGWYSASGTTSWSGTAGGLVIGTNTLYARAKNGAGLYTQTSIVVYREAPNSEYYSGPGSGTFTVPVGVYNISVVVIGAGAGGGGGKVGSVIPGQPCGGGGGGGGLVYVNQLIVTPGESFSFVSGSSPSPQIDISPDGGNSQFIGTNINIIGYGGHGGRGGFLYNGAPGAGGSYSSSISRSHTSASAASGGSGGWGGTTAYPGGGGGGAGYGTNGGAGGNGGPVYSGGGGNSGYGGSGGPSTVWTYPVPNVTGGGGGGTLIGGGLGGGGNGVAGLTGEGGSYGSGGGGSHGGGVGGIGKGGSVRIIWAHRNFPAA